MNLKDVGIMAVTLEEFIQFLESQLIVLCDKAGGSVADNKINSVEAKTLIHEFVKAKLLASLNATEDTKSCTHSYRDNSDFHEGHVTYKCTKCGHETKIY